MTVLTPGRVRDVNERVRVLEAVRRGGRGRDEFARHPVQCDARSSTAGRHARAGPHRRDRSNWRRRSNRRDYRQLSGQHRGARQPSGRRHAGDTQYCRRRAERAQDAGAGAAADADADARELGRSRPCRRPARHHKESPELPSHGQETRYQGGRAPAANASLLIEGPAAAAELEMPSYRATPLRAATGRRQLQTHVGAQDLSGLPPGGERRPRFEDERLDP